MLSGLKVLEMANVISGPYGAMLLGDLGAEVIKVEMPGAGDPFRKWAGGGEGIRPSFAAFNRGKKSVTINVKSNRGREAYLRLASKVDVVIDNFRPGTLDGFGVGYDEIYKTNPTVIYCAATGMGPTGPYRDRPTYDAIAQAMSGLWSQLTDMQDPEPVGPPMSDQLTGLFAAYGILGSLVSRSLSGKGRKIDVSMLSASVAFQPLAIAEYLLSGVIPDKTSRPHASQSYAFVASDGLPFAIHLSSPPKFWRSLLKAVNRPDLAEDPRFLDKADRVRNYGVLRQELSKLFSTRPRREWLDVLGASDVPAGPILNIAEALSDPQVESLNMVKTFGKGHRALPLAACAVGYDDSIDEAERPVPLLGEHTVQVLSELGYEESEIHRMKDDGAI
ncbi:MAG: CaiB/BaiF CoA-transferase family protein [Hyphomicrobiales bacterium]|nr:CaiB/BaiF CoA-transferase family protein [Hyphomicrobiales bacterium]